MPVLCGLGGVMNVDNSDLSFPNAEVAYEALKQIIMRVGLVKETFPKILPEGEMEGFRILPFCIGEDRAYVKYAVENGEKVEGIIITREEFEDALEERKAMGL